MKPVAIFRHSLTEGPGYFVTYLERIGRPWQLVRIDAGDAVPSTPAAFSGLAFMGGPMSVNDPLPWIAQVLDLIRESVHLDVPVIGHCLGGQLMSLALGGTVGPNPVKEIGWGEVTVLDDPVAAHWLGGGLPSFLSFHWHGETFTVPPGARRVMASRHCENQAFAFGRHFAMQCHVEITAELIASWCSSGVDEIAASPGPAVQSPDEIQRDLSARLARLHAVSERIYARWVEALAD